MTGRTVELRPYSALSQTKTMVRWQKSKQSFGASFRDSAAYGDLNEPLPFGLPKTGGERP
jgi:hypothetical protein